jgi:tRNA threonylcarbamoyladenosine biosynthesis protein TsaB
MEIIDHPNAHFIEDIEPLAKWMQPLAERRFLQERFEDVAYFVPFYLKDFVAIKPKKLL